MNTAFSLEWDGDERELTLMDAHGLFHSLKFLQSPSGKLLGAQVNAMAFQASPAISASVVAEGNTVQMTFSRADTTPTQLAVTLVSDLAAPKPEWGGGGAVDLVGDMTIVTMLEAEMTLTFRDVEGAPVFQAMTAGVLLVPSARRAPEFAVGVYDDQSFLRPRLIRQGAPVISTVPVDGPGIKQDEATYLTAGVGPEHRTMYFKVLCDQAIPTSTPIHLSLWLPNGLDTLLPPVHVPLAYAPAQGGWTGSYLFHREDTVDYVDGYTYLAVYCPMHVQRSLPMRLQVSASSHVVIGSRYPIDSIP